MIDATAVFAEFQRAGLLTACAFGAVPFYADYRGPQRDALGVMATTTTLTLPAASVQSLALAVGSIVTVGAAQYRVAEIEGDGIGAVTLALERAA